MSMLAAVSTVTPGLSAHAQRLFDVFHAEPVHWIVLNKVSLHRASGLSEQEIAAAVEELEAADLVERASYGPLLYIL